MDKIDRTGCAICPRRCGGVWFCEAPETMSVARAALHFWEEPCISGEKGSGCVFFCGCNLRCVFCQNVSISQEIPACAKEMSPDELAEVFLHLEEAGANNINLVTAGPYVPLVAETIGLARQKGLKLPIVYNTSSYETVEALQMLDGKVDIYLPDFKLWSSALCAEYLRAPNYREVAVEAIREMVRQCAGDGPQFDENGLMKRGVIVRHMLMPGCVEEGKKILYHLSHQYGQRILYSLLSQYVPIEGVPKKIARRVTEREYEKLTDYAWELGLEDAFVQDLSAGDKGFIPPFDGTIL